MHVKTVAVEDQRDGRRLSRVGYTPQLFLELPLARVEAAGPRSDGDATVAEIGHQADRFTLPVKQQTADMEPWDHRSFTHRSAATFLFRGRVGRGSKRSWGPVM